MISKFLQKDGSLIAILFKYSDLEKGTNFYTDNELPFQFATMQRSKGELVRIHKHKQRKNLVESTTEVLIIKSGFIKVTLLSDKKELISEVELKSNDLIILYKGYHGIKFVEDTIMFEIKQGPYLEENCKEFLPND